jgi:hypothetical protein
VTMSNRLMAFYPWCVLQAKGATIVGCVSSWTIGSNLKMFEFPLVVQN